MRIFVILCSLSFLAVGLFFGLFFFPGFGPAREQRVVIPHGASAIVVADTLAAHELVFSSELFLLYVRIFGDAGRLRAGHYTMQTKWSMRTLLRVLVSPNTHARLIRVTIPEGFSMRQIAGLLGRSHLGVTSQELLGYWHGAVFSDYLGKYAYLQTLPTASVEGYLFPDTYFFSQNSTPKSITGLFFDAFDNRIVRRWQSALVSANRPLRGLHDYLTLASLIEKEARLRSEMPRIAGVFLNRLKKGMPLATDPTVLYALGELRRPLLYRDLTVVSPYNTYRNRGLPPTPIASPGMAAFEAALHPEAHAYYFFVALPKGGGAHTFTRTYREHLRVQGY